MREENILQSEQYPEGTVRALLRTDLVTRPTAEALTARLMSPPDAPQFFDAALFSTLSAICARLATGGEHPTGRDLALLIDQRLAKGDGDGWRYDSMPPDQDAYRQGLKALNQQAQTLYNTPFAALSPEQQDAILHWARPVNAQGASKSESEAALPNAFLPRFVEELLTEAAEYFYSHPAVQETIGYVGMADARGWKAIGLNEREAWELMPVEGRARANANKDASEQILAAATVAPGTARQDARPPLAADAQSSFPTAPPASLDPVDVLVIGTGAGGAPLLARLAQAGLRVVALEAGRHWNPEQDFATDEYAQMKLYWRDERLSAGQDPVAFGSNNSGIGVGGSTLHYTAYTPRCQPDDLRLYSEFGVGVDWPLAFQDIEPYYGELERFLGVSGPALYPWGPARAQGYPLPPLPLNGAAQLMQRACATLGVRTSPAPNAALSKAYHQEGVGWRPACTNRGFCQAGCSVRAKGSMDVTFLPLAVGAGAEIRTGCFVTQIETDSSGRVTGVVYTQEGREQRQTCRSLFVCAGAIETPRLLLMNGLANHSGQVGRNFMAHTGLQIWGEFEEFVRPYKGIPGGLISEDTHRPNDADFAGGYLLQSIGVMPVTYATQFARSQGVWGEDLRNRMHRYNHVAGINILGDCLPYEHNYVELSDEKDARGLPKPRIHFTNGDNERKMTAHADGIMRSIWDAAGAQNVWAFPRNAHTIGTCRMGHDPNSSVVNADCRAHDIPNLYIVDNSVFPSALGVNPALTIMALSLRAADQFIKANQ